MEALRNWFDQLTVRERAMVLSAALLVVFAIMYLAGLRPLLVSAARNEAVVEDQQALLGELTQIAARRGPQRGGAVGNAGRDQSLVVMVDRTTREKGLATYLKRNQPDGADSIRLRFEDAPFDNLVSWLVEMQSTYGVGAVSANIDTSRSPGRVNCNLVLSRAAG
jgi:general secretion pathway protein M